VIKEATVDSVRQWVQKHGVEVVSIRQTSHEEAPCKSFKVTISKQQVKALLQDDFKWPRAVKVRRFVPRLY